MLQSGTPFTLNFVFLVFLLVPGYAVLQGWLNSTVQVDSTSRLDKIFITVLGGILTLALILLLYRFGIFEAVKCALVDNCVTRTPGYNPNNSVSPSKIDDHSALSLLLFMGIQSLLGYSIAYIGGTVHRANMEHRGTSEKELEQPLETAIEQSTLGEKVSVVTHSGDQISGQLYRIGSPSENKDILISGAERIGRDNQDGKPEKLGVTYLDHEDISQIQFPDLLPMGPGPESNFFLRQYEKCRSLKKEAHQEFWYGYYRGLLAKSSLSDRITAKIGVDNYHPLRRLKNNPLVERISSLSQKIRGRDPIFTALLLKKYFDNK